MSEPHASRDASLQAVSLSKHFGGLRAVADVSLDVHTDEIHAVIGPNGAGKSTLINLLSGDMHVSGRLDHARQPRRDAAWRGRPGSSPRAAGRPVRECARPAGPGAA